MRIKRFDMKAFGPFTDRILELDSKKPGLHIIFGANEAGKSSSLRALKALLYGFPERTSDNFIHSNNQLLVGGFLENRDGRTISFQRRKKRKANIIDEEGNPLDMSVLAPFLQGVDPEIFESLYGIDHEALVRGGEEILAQKGEVGQALFAAGAGLSSLRDIIEQLEKEASELFKATGQLPEINKAVIKYKDIQKEVKASTLSSKEWKDHQKALKSAEDERAELEMERAAKNKELHCLERLERAIPELGSLKSLQEQLKALKDVTILPDDFSEQHNQVSQEIREARAQLERDSEKLKQLKEKKEAIAFDRELLDQADLVDDFHQRLGEYRKGQKDKPERNGMRIALCKEAAVLLKQVRPDLSLETVETLRPVLSKKRTIQTLSARYESINQQLLQADKIKKEADQELKETDKSLATVPVIIDFQGLLQAVKLAQRAGHIDQQIEKNGMEVEEGKKICLAKLKRIGLWAGNLTDLMELSLPLSETMKQFDISYSDLADQRRGLDKDRKNAQTKLKNAKTEIKKVEYAGEIPSEEELIRTREKRERGWQLLRRQWLDKEDVSEETETYDSSQPLPDAYEGQVELADLIADRLRREAERVANAAALRAQLETQEEILSECDKNQEKLDQREKELNKTWADIWKPLAITPFSPKEMSGWLAEMDKLRYKVGDILKKEQEIERDRNHRNDLSQALIKELKAIGKTKTFAGEELGAVLVFAETVVDGITKQATDLEKLKDRKKNSQKSISRARDDLNAAQEALTKWHTKWQTALSGLGLTEVSTLDAIDIIDTLQSCFDKVKEADDLQSRINGIDHDAGELEKDVRSLLEKLTPGMLELHLEQAILQLRTMLNQVQKDSTLYDKLSEECDLLQTEVSRAEKTLKNANEQLNKLLRIAKCENPEDLPATISRSNEYQRLQEKISDTQVTLGKIAEGVSIEKLAQQAAEVNFDELPGLIESLIEDIDKRINPEINRISQIVGEESVKVAAMDGSANSAEAAEKMEEELVRIRRLANRYVRVKLASKILQQEIERYRDKHQDPVLKLASKYFADLTLGSFAGLRTDVDDSGDPILIGIRPDGSWLTVEGMSGGSRDQLYLALRLATLEWRLESSEPMPFIVDDILINFDDARSQATIQVLSELSERNQVVLFTHHDRIVEDAKKIKKGTVQIHEL
ncbi:MAG: AAA family ATPase [Thermodesulfobacteriota bacterium]|nr:AAA family ATPase [Thermodesulfobacteriota bacterium]